jgi:two-component system chemotaxis response regulator CheB
MPKIRVLVVDDAVVIRSMVSDLLSSDPAFEVVGMAANGRIALAMIPEVVPDIITLDVEMPEMNGLDALVEIRKLYPCLPVIMFSALTEWGATATLDALALGASDFVTKPANVGSVSTAIRRIRDDLIPKIKHLCPCVASFAHCSAVSLGKRLNSTVDPSAGQTLARSPAQTARIGILAIGVSTGGPNALAELLPKLPSNFRIPIVIVQHMPEIFTKLLAERLDKSCSISVSEGMTGDTLKPGHAFVAPGDYHMVVRRDGFSVRLETNKEQPENSCRPAVDVLFSSVVKAFGPRTLGVVLTGMGKDGLRGCGLIKDAGGQVVVQDNESSVVWGMPGYVANAGLADRVLPLKDIAHEIMRRVESSGSHAPMQPEFG